MDELDQLIVTVGLVPARPGIFRAAPNPVVKVKRAPNGMPERWRG
jgi:hypothetical protein